MNKFRLNQILEILTFPYTDTRLMQEDALAEQEDAWCAYIDHTERFSVKGRGKAAERYEKARKNFGEYLCRLCSGRARSMDDVLLASEKFFSHNRIMEDMSHKWKGAKRKEMVARCYAENIFWIANSLLTSRDGIIAIRTWKNKSGKEFPEDILGTSGAFDKVEIWNTLMRIVTPDLFIAAFVVLNGNQVEMFYRQGANISLADKLLMENLKKGMAETHMHINVSSDYLMLWEKTTNLAIWKEYIANPKSKFDGYDYVLFHVSVYRCMAAYFLEYKAPEECRGNFLMEEFPELLRSMEEPEVSRWETREEKILYFEMMEKKWQQYLDDIDVLEMRNKDILYGVLYERYEELDTSAEYIFLAKSLGYIRRNQDMAYTRLFLQYIRIKNTFFSRIFQRNTVQGLNWFQNYFSRASGFFRRGMTKERRWDYILKTQMNIRDLKKLELRMSVDTERRFYNEDDRQMQLELQKEILKEVGSFLVHYRDYIRGRTEAPTVGLVLHFNKRASLDNTAGYFCWRCVDEAQLYNSGHKIALRRKYVNIARAIAEIRNAIPYLDEYLVGLDAASDENAAEPWIFSPAYNEVRNRRYSDMVKVYTDTNGERSYKRIHNIGLTYHVGEDYRHILSGLRHIDEVIEKYNYRSCDRIGHGIALGADVDYWMENSRNVLISLGEYLDNLLWVWGVVIENKCVLPVSAYALEGKILETAVKIYGNMDGITVHVLYQAYQEKFKKNFTELFRKHDRDMREQERGTDTNERIVCRYGTEGSSEESWNLSKIVCTYFCPVYENKYNQVIWLETTEEDAKLLKALQMYMMEKIRQRGIYIETNPTSNLAIGEIESLYSHYILNLNSLEKKNSGQNLMVTINSDDPMVFNTNVENELAYMYHGLINAGYDSRTTLEWIDKVRQYGLESSFIARIKTVQEMEREITIMQQEIENFRKR